MRTLIIPAIVASAAVAHAEPAVLAVEGEAIYVDLGAKDGVGAGSELELLHEVVAKDPRTGAVLRDRFALGTLVVVKSGEKVSVASAPAELAKRVLAGDRVRLVSAKRSFIDPWAAKVEASRAVAPGTTPVRSSPTASGAHIDHVALARDAWVDTLGQPPERRIERWQKLVAADPQSPYRKLVENEIESLRGQITARDEALAKARSASAGDRDPRIARLAEELARTRTQPVLDGGVLAIAPLTRAVPKRPIDMSFLVTRPGALREAWLFVQPPGEVGFRRVPLVRDGDSYLRATIDAEAAKSGALAWYVEGRGTGADDDVAPILGSPQRPEVITVDDEVAEPAIASGRTSIHTHVDYVDFDGKLATGFDQYYQAEIDFTYRFLHPVYAVRLGFGTLSGTGGPVDVIDEDPMDRCLDANDAYQCRQVTFSYVFTELEFRVRPNIALMIRPQAGLLTTDRRGDTEADRCRGSDVMDCNFDTGFGARARVRFGEETGTNLVVGVGVTDGVGTLLEAAYNWLPSRVVPVQLTVQVTDQPVVEDFGVRLIGDVGWRKLSWFYPSLRVSYQARDIDHAGVSGGLAMNFDW